MASLKVYHNDDKRRQLWVDAGMNYDIFLGGRTDYNFTNTRYGQQIAGVSFSNPVSGKFLPSKYSNTPHTYDVNGLDVAWKVQVRYIYKRYTIMAYYNSSLYDLRATIGDDATTSLKSRYAGVSVGYTIF